MGDGTAGSGHLPCKQDIRWVQIPYPPPLFAPVVQRQETNDLGSLQCQFESDREYHWINSDKLVIV